MMIRVVVRRASVAVGIAAAMFTCTPPITLQPFMICEEYQTANLSNRLLIVEPPAENKIVVENPKDVVDDYGGMNAAPESRIRKYYIPLFLETFTSYLSGDSQIIAGSGHPYDRAERREVRLALGQDSTELVFSIPSKNAMLQTGFDSAVVVQIREFTFKRNNFYIEYYWDDKTKRPANLEANATILIWDYKTDRPVFYGTLTQKTEFQIAMQRKHWDESARMLAKKIVLTARCL